LRITLLSATAVSSNQLPISREVSIPLDEVLIRTSRSSGPGGQHANVTASRVDAIYDVAASSALTEEQKRRVMGRLGPRVTATAQDSRSQARNRDLALERLAGRLAAALAVPKHRRPTRPTAASRRSRLEAKQRQAARKQARRPPSPEE
jgi:ribosome-associated protein